MTISRLIYQKEKGEVKIDKTYDKKQFSHQFEITILIRGTASAQEGEVHVTALISLVTTVIRSHKRTVIVTTSYQNILLHPSYNRTHLYSDYKQQQKNITERENSATNSCSKPLLSKVR